MARRQQRKRRQRRREHARRHGWQTRHSVITGAGIAATATLGLAAGAHAAATYYYVGSTSDDQGGPYATDCSDPSNIDCTLRDAILAANANSGFADTIMFNSSLSGTPIVLGANLPTITDPVYIEGNGPGNTTVSGAYSYRIFDINLANDGDRVVINSMTLSHGFASGPGAAINNYNGTLYVDDSFLTGNLATTHGGAIYSKDKAVDTGRGQNNRIAYSTFTQNAAGIDGGAVYGYYSVGTIGTSTFQGNVAGREAGAVSSFSPSFTYSTTISGNTATYGGGFRGHSLGFLYNSIVGGNTATSGQGPADPDTAGNFYAAFDLVTSPGTTSLFAAPSHPGPNITGAAPQLGAPALNGGDTLNMKPAATSPAVDKGFSGNSYDQRGQSRPVDNPNATNAAGGDGGDIGSVELTLAEGPGPAPPTPTPSPTPTSTFNVKAAIKKCKKKFPHNAAKRKKCIKNAKRRAQVSSSPWRAAAHRWARSAPTPSGEGHHAFRLGGR